MTAAPAAPELRPPDCDHFDTGFAQQRVGRGVAVISDNHARLEGDDIVAIIPLLSLLIVGIPASLNDIEFFEP